MKKRLLLLGILLAIPFVGTGQTELPFQVGEKLIYESHFNLLRAGTAQLHVSARELINEVPVYHIIFTAKTNPFLDRIYKIRDTVETWIDAKQFFTRKFSKKVREGNYSHTFSASVNYQDSVMTAGEDSYKIHQELRDPYSLFYYLRTIPLRVGDQFSFVTFDNNRFINIYFNVNRRETISVGAGKFDCLVIEPFQKERPLFKQKGDMTIWFSDDDQRLPVKIVSKTRIGSMVLKLQSFEN